MTLLTLLIPYLNNPDDGPLEPKRYSDDFISQ